MDADEPLANWLTIPFPQVFVTNQLNFRDPPVGSGTPAIDSQNNRLRSSRNAISNAFYMIANKHYSYHEQSDLEYVCA